jgi:DNA-binding HxlR family transcriptional regulator
MPDVNPQNDSSAVARSLSILGERWTLLIIREALYGVTRFESFRLNLGVTPDVLSGRLATLVEHGIMTRKVYRDPGQRARYEYPLTETGRELELVVGALQQWGDAHLPRPQGPSVVRRSRVTGQRVRAAFVDDRGDQVPERQLDIARIGPRILHLTWLQWEPQFPVVERR